MMLQQLGLPQTFSGVAYGVAAIAVAIVVISRLSSDHKLDAFPTVGSTSLWAAIKRMIDATDVVREGYEKHQSAPFKYMEQLGWVVVVSSRQHIEELRSAPDDVLSSEEGLGERLNTKYTVIKNDDVFFDIGAVVRSQMNRNIGVLYPGIKDEIVTAFDEVLDLKGNEWKRISVSDTAQKVVCRTSNRLYVGLPLCRDPDWIALNIQYTIHVFLLGLLIAPFPRFMKPLLAYILGGATRRGRARGFKHLAPMIKERLRCFDEYGKNWDGKPNDLISWFIEVAERSKPTVESLVNGMMAVNVSSIHTSSITFERALCYLAKHPQHIQLLREEVETIVEREGWSKDSLAKMHKLDSLLRETLRFDGINALILTRLAMKDFTFSDGTFIPKGTLISAAAQSVHHDDRFYENAMQFDPFRFSNMHEKHNGTPCQFVSTGTEYLPFGHGKRACPGRFFASTELKSMLAHVIVTYDIKSEDDGKCSKSTPTRASRVLFRKRLD